MGAALNDFSCLLFVTALSRNDRFDFETPPRLLEKLPDCDFAGLRVNIIANLWRSSR